MKNLCLVVFLICGIAAGAADGVVSTPSAETPASGMHPWVVELRAGLVTTNPDQAVVSDKWEHQPLESYSYTLGANRSFPQAWTQFRFFGGTEFGYLTAREEMKGAYKASIKVTIMEWYGQGGVIWKPRWLGGDAGVRVATRWSLWGKKTSKLDAEGFTQDLGEDSTHVNRGLLAFPLCLVLTGFYDFGDWQVSGNLEAREKGTIVTAGVGYGF